MDTFFKRVISIITVIAVSAGMIHISSATVKAEKVKESTGYTIKVNLGTNCTTIYNSKGKAIKAMICSPSSETPTGTFYVPVKYKWHEMIGNCYAQYCTRITTGILFHSVWYYKKYDKSTMSVAAYNVMGNKASHGCVRLLCKDAKWIYDHCAVGTKIVIFWGNKKDDPIKRPSFTPIKTGAFTSWDPTDPDKKNPYRKAKPTIKANVKTVEYGSKVKAKDLVTALDSTGNEVQAADGKLKVKGKINTKKLGKYKITYTAIDVRGNKKKKSFTFKVVDTKKPKIKGAKNKNNVAMGSSVNVLNSVKANAVSGKDLTSKIKVSVKYKNKKVKVSKGVVKFTNKGTYKITYKVKGNNKKTASKTVKYKVTDQRVKLSLNSTMVTINEGDAFDPLSNVKALKTYKGVNISIHKYVKYSGSVDTAKPGTYTITYKAQYKDKAYTAKSITCKVVVKAVEQPDTPTLPTQPDLGNPEDTDGNSTEG